MKRIALFPVATVAVAGAAQAQTSTRSDDVDDVGWWWADARGERNE